MDDRAPTAPAHRKGPNDNRPVCLIHRKIAFASQEIAERAANSIRGDPSFPRDKLMAAYYPVKESQGGECGWWHVGHDYSGYEKRNRKRRSTRHPDAPSREVS